MSGAHLFRLRAPPSRERYIKIAEGDGLSDLRGEVERTRWLYAKGASVPDLLRVFDDGRRGAVLMTALPGSHPQDLRRPAADVVRHLARGLRALHAIAAADCPFDESTPLRLARARTMIAEGRVERAHFAARNRRRSPQSIHARLAADIPRVEDIAVVHGDAKFDNLLIDHEGHVGFIDCGHAGRGDRYLDLEAVTSDIAEHFGRRWIGPFAQAYGIALEPARLRFFSDLYELF